jgi:1,4-dihydroxy-2-naphthoyl-CoA hydrolase
MALWFGSPTVEDLARKARGTMLEHVGIEYVELGDDFISARMPVDARTRQPYGILHGGASAVLAESLGSVASSLIVDPQRQRVAGIEINCNHVRSVASGWVLASCRPLHLGRTLHVWDIRIEDEAGRLTCVSRLTVAVLNLPQGPGGQSG